MIEKQLSSQWQPSIAVISSTFPIKAERPQRSEATPAGEEFVSTLTKFLYSRSRGSLSKCPLHRKNGGRRIETASGSGKWGWAAPTKHTNPAADAPGGPGTKSKVSGPTAKSSKLGPARNCIRPACEIPARLDRKLPHDFGATGGKRAAVCPFAREPGGWGPADRVCGVTHFFGAGDFKEWITPVSRRRR